MKDTHHIKFSIRVNNKPTSITLKKNIIVLWIMFGLSLKINLNDPLDFNGILMNKTTDFIYHSLDKWTHKTAKGLSDFVTEEMINKIFSDKEDKRLYKFLMRSL